MPDANDAMSIIKLGISLGGFCLALVGGVVVRDRQVSKRIDDGDQKTHNRIDELKDELNDKFARKDEVRDSIKRVERGIETLGTTMQNNHTALTALIVKESDNR